MKKYVLLFIIMLNQNLYGNNILDVIKRAHSLAHAQVEQAIEERYQDGLCALSLHGFGLGMIFGFIGGLGSFPTSLAAAGGNTLLMAATTTVLDQVILKYGDIDENAAFVFLQNSLPKHHLSWLPQLKQIYISHHHLYSNIIGFALGLVVGQSAKMTGKAINKIFGKKKLIL